MPYEEEEQWRLLARVGAYIVLPALVLFIAGIIGLIVFILN